MTAALASGATLAAVLDRVAAVVAVAVPGLDPGDARVLVTQAASWRGALGQLDRHLAAFPDALASGSSDVPKAVIALAGLLASAGHPGVRVPRCAGCGAVTTLRYRTEGGRLCDTCRRRSRAEPCAACGQVRPVTTRRGDSAALCGMCHRSPGHACASCGQVAPVYARTPAGPACKTCYTPPARACGECGEQRPIGRRATATEPDLCKRCLQRPVATCAVCGQPRRCNPRASE